MKIAEVIPMERKCGVLMPVFSLPTEYGIGTFGKDAYAFVDFLKKAKQAYWQVLPVNPTSYGDSPYQSFSAFALNPYFIDLDELKEEGLLTQAELDPLKQLPSDQVDYGWVYYTRYPVLRKAYDRFLDKGLDKTQAYQSFEAENASWLKNYASFMVLKALNNGASFHTWSAELRDCHSQAVKDVIAANQKSYGFYVFLQYEAFAQYAKLKDYAHSQGIKIIGDIPIYVASDSADVWGSPNEFKLGRDLEPTFIAGVPPDYFSKTGQLWGNPIYDYEAMAKGGFAWWKSRIVASKKIYDILRIDHFRGMADFWQIPAGSEDARPGKWVTGPGRGLVDAIKAAADGMPIIAEDLGVMSDAVKELKAYAGWPGMKIFQFAFDAHSFESPDLPKNYEKNCVAYLGTHDNETTEGFIASHPDLYPWMAQCLGVNDKSEFFQAMADQLAMSRADTVIYTMQDVLRLGDETRLNAPATTGGHNWKFRLPKDYAKEQNVYWLRALVEESKRA